MDIGTLRGILTLILMLAFLGIVFWAYSKNRKKDFEEASPSSRGRRRPTGVPT